MAGAHVLAAAVGPAGEPVERTAARRWSRECGTGSGRRFSASRTRAPPRWCGTGRLRTGDG
ncbi:hypothetical protein, partial [Streptomyces tricolor]